VPQVGELDVSGREVAKAALDVLGVALRRALGEDVEVFGLEFVKTLEPEPRVLPNIVEERSDDRVLAVVGPLQGASHRDWVQDVVAPALVLLPGVGFNGLPESFAAVHNALLLMAGPLGSCDLQTTLRGNGVEIGDRRLPIRALQLDADELPPVLDGHIALGTDAGEG
jgi:hypothetical protein